ncbi:Leukocyte receptor cluster member 1 [Lunasporangiospora selenospora]|uniref:Leukocyte receptor cluster member 1 n=1 Tax=Lunasporangiospora selenospora TaxID=979761 RepID=A0A9P6KED3_9FUNG|nr:Leukocyte receptor cluster member 1 [Lunasporangiospora selenospora]
MHQHCLGVFVDFPINAILCCSNLDSWHVYNQKNQDRVKKDEAQAAAEEKQTRDRAITADREHRLDILRKRALERQSNSINFESGGNKGNGTLELGEPKDGGPKAPVQHINFWSDLEQHDTKSKSVNPENEEEKKRKEDKWNRTIAMHLDTPFIDRGVFSKIREDPMTKMNALLDERKQSTSRKRSPSPVYRPRDRHRSKFHGGSSKSSNNESRPSSEGMSTIEKLRKERFEREQAERDRTRALLNPNYINPRDRSIGEYSQQFNPRDTNRVHGRRLETEDQHTARRGHDHPRGRDRHNSSHRGSSERRSRPY